MPDPGSSDSRVSADLVMLPAEIAAQSLSQTQIILPRDAALAAIAHLAKEGRRVVNWEGWVKFKDGTRAKSLTHGGSFALPRDAMKAAEVAKTGIERSQSHWDRNPEYEGTVLYFVVNFGD